MLCIARSRRPILSLFSHFLHFISITAARSREENGSGVLHGSPFGSGVHVDVPIIRGGSKVQSLGRSPEVRKEDISMHSVYRSAATCVVRTAIDQVIPLVLCQRAPQVSGIAAIGNLIRAPFTKGSIVGINGACYRRVIAGSPSKEVNPAIVVRGNASVVLPDYVVLVECESPSLGSGLVLQITLRENDLFPVVINSKAPRQRAGVYVTLATGRGFLGASKVQRELGIKRLTINYGGAMIVDAATEQPFMVTELESRVVTDILDLAEGLGLHAHLYQGDGIVYEREHPYGSMYAEHLGLPARIEPEVRRMVWQNVPKVLIITEQERVPYLLPYFTRLLAGRCAVSASSPGFIEFNKIGASKGSALRLLSEHLGIERRFTAAIGDNTLDSEMIEWAGLGACVANGSSEVKKIADVTVPACEDDGVAYFIENYIL